MLDNTLGIEPTVDNDVTLPDDLIVKIEQLKWWDWDHQTIKERLSDFRDMEAFMRKYL